MNNSPENISKNLSDTPIKKVVERNFFRASAEDFKKIPGSPIAYWVSAALRSTFDNEKVNDVGKTRVGLQTGDNSRFVRQWYECSVINTDFHCQSREESETKGIKWVPYNKGGQYRRWFGNVTNVVDWENDGYEIFEYARKLYGSPTRTVKNSAYYFLPSITWSKISSGAPSFRWQPSGAIFDVAGASVFYQTIDFRNFLLGMLNNKVVTAILKAISPTLNFETTHIAALPVIQDWKSIGNNCGYYCNELIEQSKQDWDSYETSWDFTTLPLLHPDHHHPTLAQTYTYLRAQWQNTTLEMQRLEEENNRIFIGAYGLKDELTPDVPLEEITLTCNPRYRYGRGKTDEDYDTLLRCDTVKELISYAIGCMMGRYSLDEPGLVYAHSGNQGFDPDRYQTFPADEDGILPVMDMDWFDDDATRRLSTFIQCVWPEPHLDDNLSFISDCLSPRAAESPLDTIRRYLSTTFFKDHMRTYKKRPIYWLFSSGRQKAFTCLVYLHRYHPATLSRMRSHYVTPLQGKLAARMEFLDHEWQAAGTPSAQKKIQTQMDLLKKKQAELNAFDDELRHYADLKIDLDLDDGVKVNYAKFGNLLAERKGITGK